MLRHARIPALAILALVPASCSDSASLAAEVATPLTLEASAYDAAGLPALPDPERLDPEGLHNVVRLSDNVISGGEPHGEPALAALASMGVKTILSVDGKAPDAETAARLGMRYVHVPIQYRGMTDEELLQITKTFREQDGPFYVHCFHGVHRGPAAAAVGRLVLDGAPREQAIAEMRQYCGTSPKYEGLYAEVALGDVPTAAETAAYDWDFPATHEPDGMRQLMVEVSRHYDNIEGMAKNGWRVTADHPDVDPVNEASILQGLFGRATDLDGLDHEPAALRDGLALTLDRSVALADVLGGIRQAGGQQWAPADEAFTALKASCNACHLEFRN